MSPYTVIQTVQKACHLSKFSTHLAHKTQSIENVIGTHKAAGSIKLFDPDTTTTLPWYIDPNMCYGSDFQLETCCPPPQPGLTTTCRQGDNAHTIHFYSLLSGECIEPKPSGYQAAEPKFCSCLYTTKYHMYYQVCNEENKRPCGHDNQVQGLLVLASGNISRGDA
jgi:hypothetical protein